MLDFNEPANVYSLPSKPNADAMRVMVDMLFRMASKGRIELAWTSDVAPHTLNSARMFGPEDMEDLVDRAVRLNETPNRNVYVSAGLRRETVDSDHRATDADVFAVTAVKADFDAPGALDAAWRLLKQSDLLPNMVVLTGNHPHTRGQMWWVLDEPTDDLPVARELERRLAIWLGGDKSIINPSRVMRLGGSVAWPLKAGRKVEVTELITKTARQAAWGLEELKAAVREAVPVDAAPATPSDTMDFNTAAPQAKTGILERINKALQGEEWHNNVRDAVAHAVARGTPADIVVDLMAPLVVRAGYTIEETRRDIATMARGALAKGFAPDAKEDAPTEPERPAILHELWPDIRFTYEPELVEELFPRVGLGTIYGPSTAGKTFVTLDWMAAIATGAQLFGRDTEPVGVLYLAFEGFYGIKKRIHGIKQEKGLSAVALELVDAPWTLSEPEAWPAMREHIAAARGRLDETGYPLGVIVVDTLTAAYAGIDANSQGEVTKAMRQLKRLAMDMQCLVLVIGHTGKDTTRGMVGSFAYKSESDTFIELRTEKDEGDDTVKRRSIYIEKVKDGPSDFTLSDYALIEVRIGTKPNGKPITTCVVEWVQPVRKKSGTTYSGAYQAILNMLQDGPMTTFEVADKLGVDRSNAGKKLRSLEDDGAVFAREDGKRKVWVAIAHSLPNDNE